MYNYRVSNNPNKNRRNNMLIVCLTAVFFLLLSCYLIYRLERYIELKNKYNKQIVDYLAFKYLKDKSKALDLLGEFKSFGNKNPDYNLIYDITKDINKKDYYLDEKQQYLLSKHRFENYELVDIL